MSERIGSVRGYVDAAGDNLITVVVDAATPGLPEAGDEVQLTYRHVVKEQPIHLHHWRLHRTTPVSELCVGAEWTCTTCPERTRTMPALVPPD